MKLRIPGLTKYTRQLKDMLERRHIREIAGRSPQAGKPGQGRFVVAEYPRAMSTNIGDNIQQIAITGALQTLFPDTPVHTVKRDSWCRYSGGGISVMQGWFRYRKSFPSGDTTPLWIGAHLTDEMQAFVTRAANANRSLFGGGGGRIRRARSKNIAVHAGG